MKVLLSYKILCYSHIYVYHGAQKKKYNTDKKEQVIKVKLKIQILSLKIKIQIKIPKNNQVASVCNFSPTLQ